MRKERKEKPSYMTKRDSGQLVELVMSTLEDLKAQRITRLDVGRLTTITDVMIVASGRSDRHVRAIAEALVERCKAAGYAPLGVEGTEAGEWILVDLADVVVHVMLPRVREFYNIEKLWDLSPREEAAAR